MANEVDVTALGVSVDLSDLIALKKALDDAKASAIGLDGAIDNLAQANKKQSDIAKQSTASAKEELDALKALIAESNRRNSTINQSAQATAQAATAEQRRVKIIVDAGNAESARSKAERAAQAATQDGTKTTQSAVDADKRRIESMRQATAAADAYRAAEKARAQASQGGSTGGGAASATSGGTVDPGGKSAGEAGKLSDALSHLSLTSGGAAREYAVLLREISTGDFTRLQGSVITLSRQIGLMPLLFSAAGAAVAGVGATVAALGVGIIQGSNEIDAYNKSIIATGGAAGQTAGQLAELAKRNGEATGEYGKSRDAVAALAASGTIFSDSLENISKSVVNVSKVTGQSVEEVVADFVKLQKDPVDAIVELNDKYHFLQLSVYEQIKALEDQGKAQEAAALAEKTYSDSFAQRAKEVEDSLGGIQKAWKETKKVVSEGWDAILDVGRNNALRDLDIQIQNANQSIRQQQENGDGSQRNLDNIRVLEQKRSDLIVQYQKMTQDASDKQAEANRQQQAINDQKEWDSRTARYADNATRYAATKKKIDEQYKTISAAANTPEAIGKAKADYDQQIADLNKEFKSSGNNGVYTATLNLNVSQYTNAIKGITQDNDTYIASIKELRAEGAITQKEYYDSVLAAIDDEEKKKTQQLEAEKAYLQGVRGNAAQEIELKKKIGDVDQQLADTQKQAQEDRAKVNAQQAKDIRDYALLVAQTEQQADNFARSRQQINERASRALYQGGDTAKLQQALDAVSDKYNDLRDNLTRDATKNGSFGTDAYYESIERLDKREQEQIDNEKNYAAQRIAIQGDYTAGLNRAYEDFQAQSHDVATTVADGFTSAAQAGVNAFQNLFEGASFSLKNIEKAIQDTVARLLAQKTTSSILSLAGTALSSIFGGGSSGVGYSLGGSSANYAGIGSSGGFGGGFSLVGSARGNAFSAGRLVTSPTLTPMANGGTSLTGEAGTEGVFPLKRTSDGQLGLQAIGGGSSAPKITIINNAPVSVKTQQQSNGNGGFDTTFIIEQLKGEVANDIASGKGDITNALTGRYSLNPALGI